MGEHNISGDLEGEALRTFMRHLFADMHALNRMLKEGMIEKGVRRVGAEQEVFLVDDTWRPAKKALEILKGVNDPHFTTELALFNLEMNLDPLLFEGTVLSKMESDLNGFLDKTREVAEQVGAHPVLCGILPTIHKSNLNLDSMTPMERYRALNRALQRMRGGPVQLEIMGMDELNVRHSNVMLEACNASFQVHFQVGAEEFPNLYNTAQLAAAPVLAAATNSPLLFGRRLWRETRISLFQQSIDTRRNTYHLRERQPRVSFGNEWVRESVEEVFREDIARFRSIIGVELDEDPLAVLDAGGVPKLNALCLHNGTVWRWNRACYGITEGKPHLRIENRILPSGPTAKDEVANAAFWFGLISGLSHAHDNINEKIDFARAKDNFRLAARYGLSAQFHWFEGKDVPAQKFILQRLLPLAREGLEEKKLDRGDIDEYLGVVADRVSGGRTGSQWMLKSLSEMPEGASVSERMSALVAGMVKRQKEGGPVSTWDTARLEESGGWEPNYQFFNDTATTEIYTVQEDESLDLVVNLMDWRKIRHVPVEDNANRLVGLISYRTVLRVLAKASSTGLASPIPISEAMKTNLITVGPEASTLEAMRLMREKQVGCLPVVKNNRLIGIVTERDFMELSRQLLEAHFGELGKAKVKLTKPAPAKNSEDQES
jgi:CBS domain-containing protein/gamma-glutamylcysteine synthetase